MSIKEKIAALRKEMQKNNIDVFIVYSADPHMSEYLPAEWQERRWISGFTGSYGFVVVTMDKAGLWTDGRYFTQAADELENTGIAMYKDRVADAVPYTEWIISETSKGDSIAVNALATAHAEWEKLERKLTKSGRHLKDLPLLDQIWTPRPNPSKNEVFVHPEKRAGQSAEEKISVLWEKMKEHGATAHVISTLDDVAWTLNLRGSDVECNPVFLGYILITKETAALYVDTDKPNEEARALMGKANVEIKPYDEFYQDLDSLKGQTILVAPNENQAIYKATRKNNEIIEQIPPGNLMKAVKNNTELQGFETVMLRDGIAMVKFLYWLLQTVGKEELDEYTISRKLYDFRAAGKNFVGESFASIVGYLGNGALPHYSVNPGTAAKVTDKGSMLVDSGGQYLEGTTDITRTFPLGRISDDFKQDATMALKGMIQLSLVKFPKGTRGSQIDAYARMPLWKEGKDYNHGTGHGVGSFLNVHEGPQSIRKEMNPVTLKPGMVLSNEPGYYRENHYGIRHENLMRIKEWKTTQWNTFYEFETMTWCPFFKDIIIKDQLTDVEVNWLNNYHQKCKEKLAPHLDGEIKAWFLDLASPL